MKLLLTSALALSISTSALAKDSTTEAIGDITQLVTPLLGLGLTYYYDDKEGRWQFVKSFAASQLTVHAIKNMVDKRRPNYNEFTGKKEKNSFPSGHTSSAFGGASFIYNRYGSTWGIPAYALAAYTGYSRVYAEKHYWDDVIAGGSIAVLSSLYFVNSIDDNIAFLPKTDGDSVGVTVVVSSDVLDGKSKASSATKKPFTGKNLFEFIPSMSKFSSTDFDKAGFGIDFTGAEDEIQTSAIRWSRQANKKNGFSFLWHPYEIRAIGNFSGEKHHARYFSNDFRLAWNYGINIADNLITKAGLALVSQYSEAEVYQSPNSRATIDKSSEWLFIPLVTATIGYKFSEQAAFTLDGSYGDNGDATIADWTAGIGYQMNERWNIGAGYSWYERNHVGSKAFENIEFDNYFIKLGYHF